MDENIEPTALVEPAQDTETPADLEYRAWVLIANVSEGDWTVQTVEWQAAATKWRNDWHAKLDAERTTQEEDGYPGGEAT